MTDDDQGTDMNVHELIAFLLMEGQEVTYSTPGEITLDNTGMPDGVNPPTTSNATLTKVHLTADQWETIARHLLTEKETTA